MCAHWKAVDMRWRCLHARLMFGNVSGLSIEMRSTKSVMSSSGKLVSWDMVAG